MSGISAEQVYNTLRETYGRSGSKVSEKISALPIGKKGIILFENFWGPTVQGDHIDLWNGVSIKRGDANDYFVRSANVYFFEIP